MNAQSEKKAYGLYVRDLRESLGLDRDVFAGRIGVSSQTVRNVEQGSQNLGKAAQLAVERLATSTGATYGGPATPDNAEMIATFVVDDELREQAAKVAEITGLGIKEAVEMIIRQRLIKQ